MSRLGFSVLTVPRATDYLPGMIGSLRATGFFEDPGCLPLRLVCGAKWGQAAPALSSYRGSPEFLVEEMTREEAAPFQFQLEKGQEWNAVAQRDLGLNHRRAISSLVAAGAERVAVFEDDIRFAAGWLGRLRGTIAEVEAVHGDWWVLTLFAMFSDESARHFGEGRKWYYDKRRPFWGTQGIVYPRRVAVEIAPVVMSKCVLNYQWPIDELIGEWTRGMKIPIIGTAPSLIQHVGDVSAGCSKGGQRTHGFVEDVSP